MVGILKGLKSGDSTENNTKAFSVIIAFSGGVWRMSLQTLIMASIMLITDKSVVRLTVVLSRETQTWT